MDRNTRRTFAYVSYNWSLSARRAWIEILAYPDMIICTNVALRKESVDRNTQRRDFKALGLPSLSARRAWIEMQISVSTVVGVLGRSPQGERG